jgi:hypothetical protein
MFMRVPAELASAALLIGAAQINSAAPSPGAGIGGDTLGLLAIAIFNVFVSAHGTWWVRAFGIVCSCIGLLFPGAPRAAAVFALWLLWLPLYLAAWSVESDRRRMGAEPPGGPPAARGVLAATIGAVSLAYLAYKGIFAHQLQQTAALFIGIPTLLAIVVVLFVSPRSAKGVACKAVTVGLLVSLVFLGEGMLCILMSAPIFYAVAIGIGAAADAVRLRERNTAIYSSFLVLMFVPMSLEGVTDSMSFGRNESVTATQIIYSSALDVERAVFETPRFDRPLPLELRIGFPRPASARIERDGKPRWIVRMRGGEMRLDGMEPRAGDLVLALEEHRPGFVRWRALSDDSHMTHFLRWESSTVEWTSIDAQTTKVVWTITYRRGLDPAWYFGPWERYIASAAAGYLIDAVATP